MLPVPLSPCPAVPRWSQSELRLEGLLDHMKAKLCPSSEQEAEPAGRPTLSLAASSWVRLHPLSRPSQDGEQPHQGKNSPQHQASAFPRPSFKPC